MKLFKNFEMDQILFLYPNTNWLDETLKPFALQTRTNFQVSGGTETVRYLVSFGALTQGSGFYHQPVKKSSIYRACKYKCRS